MKKFKLVLWIIIIAFVVLVFFQNRAFFESKQSITVDLWVVEAYHSPEIFTAVWFLVVLIIWFLIAYFFALAEKFKMNKLIRQMKAQGENQEKMLLQMKQELESRSGYPSNEVVDAETVDVSTAVSEKSPSNH